MLLAYLFRLVMTAQFRLSPDLNGSLQKCFALLTSTIVIGSADSPAVGQLVESTTAWPQAAQPHAIGQLPWPIVQGVCAGGGQSEAGSTDWSAAAEPNAEITYAAL